MKFSKFTIPILFIALLVAVFSYKMYSCCHNKAEYSTPKRVSLKEARDLFDSDKKIGLLPIAEQSKVIHVFTTWCECCKNEITEIEKISANHKITGLVWSKSNEDAQKWLKENGNHYDEVGIIDDQEVLMLGVSKTPITMMLDHEGNVKCALNGPLTEKDFNSAIHSCIENK